MGVSGCGKSTVASKLAVLINAHFKDADDLHPPANIEKMGNGVALNDADREPWLREIALYARQNAEQHGICVIACSALKASYRRILNQAGNVHYIYLKGSKELIAARLHDRTGHFMPETLLHSQFAALEDPVNEPNVVTIDINASVEDVTHSAANALQAAGIVELQSESLNE